jgi:6-phospho-3-hexuloisomerase
MDTKANQEESVQPAEMPFLKQAGQLKKNLNMILSEQLQLAAKLDYEQIARRQQRCGLCILASRST